MGDFLEVMSLYGFDLEAASEAVKDLDPVDFSYTQEILDKIMEDSCVDKVQREPHRLP